LGETAFGWKPDSALMTAFTNACSTPYRRAQLAMIGSKARDSARE
jgi:hypothetical protein